MYQFMAEPGSSGNAQQTVPHVSTKGYEVDYVLIYNASGVLTYAEKTGTLTGTNDSSIRELDAVVRDSIIPEGFPIGISGRYGMSILNDEPVILTGTPILHANLSDPPRGTLILVRTLTEGRLMALENAVQVPSISLHPYTLSSTIPFTAEEKGRVMKGGIITRPVDRNTFEGITMITGIENRPTSIVLDIETARPIHSQIQASIFISACAIILFSAILMIVVQLLLNRFILGPISSLDNEMKLIGGDDSITRRVEESGDEEIVSLKKSLNRMLNEIQHYHEELMASRETLEERNHQLSELNRKANLYLDIYLDVISYEILNALMGLRGYADLIRSTAQGREAEFADKIEAIAKKSSDVIRNIETISQIYKNPPVNHPVHLGVAIRNEAQLFSELTIHVENCNRTVMANEMLGVVFNNLFSNCFKYGGKDVQIQVCCHDSGDGYVKVTIADNGPGIPDGMKMKVFDRFASDMKTRSSYGLGLHIVKMLVEGYGGEVWAEDRIEGKPDRGAAIRFTLTLDEDRSRGQ